MSSKEDAEANAKIALENLRVALSEYAAEMERALGKEVLSSPRVVQAIGIMVIDDAMMKEVLDKTEYKFFSFGDGMLTLKSHEAIGLVEILKEFAIL